MLLLKLKMFLSTRVGQITITLVAVVLAAILILSSATLYGKKLQKEKTEALKNEQQIQTRERIDRAIRENSRITNPDINRRWLYERNQRQ
jgi:predicted membrane protein